jgi:hypothetical protein
MRHWFLVLMIALLPLRGWVGDAMAVEMLVQPAHATMAMSGHGADHASDHGAGLHAEQAQCACDEHAAAAEDKADHQHSACDVCNVPALAMAFAGLQTPASAYAQLAVMAEPFASSEAQRGIKPPIS